MKVAIVVNEINIRGGTHKQVLRLCEYLESQRIPFKLFTRYLQLDKTYPEFSRFETEYISNEPIQRLSNKGIASKIKSRVQLYKEEKRLFSKISKDFDIINIHDNGIPNIIWWATKRKKTRVIWQINDLPGCFNVGVSSNEDDNLKKKVRRCLFRILAHSVDLITVNVTKNKLQIRNNMGIDAEVLYCGVDSNKELIKHSYSKKETFNLLSSGVFYPYRNYEALVEAVSLVREKGRSINLKIIGSTEHCIEYAEKIRHMIRDKHLSDCIIICGQVDENKYNELHNNADAFIFINVNQSWGLAVFEAMSCGLPVIVSDSVGATELLDNNTDAVFVDPFNSKQIASEIIKLMDDVEHYNYISQNAFTKANNMTWDNMYCTKLIKLFNQLLEN
ncbi:MAG: glycosyltransferase family 4 protein [Clostridia bacterium]|nr:glycosyltransferase family 4 protein [Clostridia bacterium]